MGSSCGRIMRSVLLLISVWHSSVVLTCAMDAGIHALTGSELLLLLLLPVLLLLLLLLLTSMIRVV